MTIKHLSILIALLSCMANSALSQEVCSSSTALHVAVFNTQGTSDAPDVTSRATAMASVLPMTADAQSLDVLCLNELRDAGTRAIVLQGFQSDPSTTWYSYQPPAISQPGCQYACVNNLVYNFNDVSLPLNAWMEVCSLSPVNGASCAQSSSQAGFESCVQNLCPFLNGFINSSNNAQCRYCIQDSSVGQDITHRVNYCAAIFNPQSEQKCIYGHNGEAGGTLVSRYPFLATAYHQFAPPDNTSQLGLDNWGISYGKIQSPIGPVHLFCASHATLESGMSPGAAQPLNQSQVQDALNYIASMSNGEPAIFMSDTGSGPMILNSQTGSADAIWPANFATLKKKLNDALLRNLDAAGKPNSDPACTYDCDTANAAYVDHIMSSGLAVTEWGNQAMLCNTNGNLIFSPLSGGYGLGELSDHFGVTTDFTLLTLETSTSASNVSTTYSSSSHNVLLTAQVTSADSSPVQSGTVTFAVSGLGSATSGNLKIGRASAVFSVPGGTATGSYTITATYNPGFNLASSSDSSHSLTISVK